MRVLKGILLFPGIAAVMSGRPTRHFAPPTRSERGADRAIIVALTGNRLNHNSQWCRLSPRGSDSSLPSGCLEDAVNKLSLAS